MHREGKDIDMVTVADRVRELNKENWIYYNNSN